MLRIGTCGSCGSGNLGIRVSASGGCVVALCDECDAVWNDCSLLDGPHFLKQPDLPCRLDGSSLRSPPAHWANRCEAKAVGWDHAIVGETEALG